MGIFLILRLLILVTKKIGFIKDLVYSVFSIGFLILIPGNMFILNSKENNLSKMYIAEDFGHNILTTCEKNAILFTNGDNDTVPLWFNQIVKNVRQDVTVVNLSLLNAPWYILHLKNGPKKLPVNFTDEQINTISFIPWKKKNVTLDVPESLSVVIDTTNIEEKEFQLPEKINFTVEPTLGDRFLRIQDYILLNILNTNKWKKPIYFSVTVREKNFIGLKQYFRLDGFAYKLIPFKNMFINPDILETNLIKKFRYRHLKDESLRYCKATESMIPNYRFVWIKLLDYYSKNNMDVKVNLILDAISKVLPQRLLR